MDEDRKHEIEAAIVRIMKARKRMPVSISFNYPNHENHRCFIACCDQIVSGPSARLHYLQSVKTSSICGGRLGPVESYAINFKGKACITQK